MPDYTRQNAQPELGFTSLGDYLNANRGPLDAGYQQDFTKAHTLGDTLQGELGTMRGGDVSGYDTAASDAMKAQEMGRQFGNRFTVAGSADPTSPEGTFNSALEWASHGSGYKNLSDYLGGYTPASVDAARAQGLAPRPAAPKDVPDVPEFPQPMATPPGLPGQQPPRRR